MKNVRNQRLSGAVHIETSSSAPHHDELTHHGQEASSQITHAEEMVADTSQSDDESSRARRVRAEPRPPVGATPTRARSLPSILAAEAASGGTTTTDRPTQPFPRGLRRLRDRLQAQEDRLRLDVNALKQEINDLNSRRLVLNTKRTVQRRLVQERSVEVVSEYFGAFQHGWIAEPTEADGATVAGSDGGPSFTMARSPRQPTERAAFLRERQRLLMDRQQHFVATALDADVTVGPGHKGREAFVYEWKRYSVHHQLPRLTLSCMTCHGSSDEPIIVAVGTLTGTLTHKALEEKYPRALSDPRLVKQLVGASIRYPSQEIFYFGREGLITRYARGLDYVHAFANVLDNLEDVAIVLADAMLWDDIENTRDFEEPSSLGARDPDGGRRARSTSLP